jgi:hypothetical protein
MILNYLSPTKVYQKLSVSIEELSNYSRFKKIVFELNEEGKLEALGIKVDSDSNMYLGIDLNPELLLYSDTSQESVELRLVSEKMNKYNDFLTREGILDAIRVDYERIQSPEYYGYILKIGFNFKKYRRFDFIYSLSYFSIIALGISFGILSLIQ